MRLLVCLATVLLCCRPQQPGATADGDAAADPAPAACGPGEPVEVNGVRKLALVVGVGKYADGTLDLAGPRGDAERIYDLLTAEGGYGFPEQNVCLLLDEAATVGGFERALERALVRWARPQDVALIYFAGHGSQTRDLDGDEPDGWDETLVLHDSRTGQTGDLVDDRFQHLLAELHAKTHRVTVIVDSCNSSTVTRGPEESTLIPRYVPPAPAEPAERGQVSGDGDDGLLRRTMPGLVTMAAAGDGTPAMEIRGRGVFTDAVIEVLSRVSDRPLTYAQAARRIPPLVEARSYQIPYFHGHLGQVVFGSTERRQPLAWEVTGLGPVVELAGPPLPGIGINAELRIYDGAAEGSETADPGKAKATVVIDASTGLTATARVDWRAAGAPAIALGDLAVLARPADSYLRLSVRLRPPAVPGGIPRERASELRRVIAEHPEAGLLVTLSEGPADFELALSHGGELQLRGPEDTVRSTYPDAVGEAQQVAEDLWQHARQGALLQLRGEGGSDFEDYRTLQASLRPAADEHQNGCATGPWEQAEANSLQVVPLCFAWYLQVRLADDSPVPLLVGAIVLSSDGGIYGLPADGRILRVEPGRTAAFDLEPFRASLPLEVHDRILVFGTREDEPVPWHLLTATARTRGEDTEAPKGALYWALDRYLQPGVRGQLPAREPEKATWTMSTLSVRVQANPRFEQPASLRSEPTRAEFTIPGFDVRPYLPDDPEAPLFRLLTEADKLARRTAAATTAHEQGPEIDGEGSVLLRELFARARLTYAGDGRVATTAELADPAGAMAESFDPCPEAGHQMPGDVLVYRDEGRDTGRALLVVDPAHRVAWGAFEWPEDLASTEGARRVAIEYQKIMSRADWRRLRSSGMRRVACWRHRELAESLESPAGRPGPAALAGACDPDQNCGRAAPGLVPGDVASGSRR